MAEKRAHRRWRLALAWGLSLAFVGGYALLGGTDDDGQPAGPATGAAAKPDEDDKLEILTVDPAEPSPGSIVVIQFAGLSPKRSDPLRAILSGKEQADILNQRSDTLAVRIPKSVKPGRNKIRIVQGKDEEQNRSKPYDIRIKPLNRRKHLGEVLGGLALLVFGLRTMSRGSRAYTGHRSQGILARIGRRTSAAVGLGVIVGGVTQFTTTAAGLVVGLVESHLLAVMPAVAVLLGAQLGAAATPSVLAIVGTARESMLVITVGVIWLSLAIDRRSEAFAKIVLGCGLLFYGVHMVKNGFEPLVSDPDLLPYIDRFRADALSGRFVCALAGVLLAAVLQGPTPVYVLVVGLAQSTGRIDLHSALAIMAGTGLGAAIATSMVTWPFGPDARRVARIHFALGLLGTVILVSTIDLWSYAADALISGHPEEVAYGKKVLLPKIGAHLGAGFALSQIAITAVLSALIPLAAKLVDRLSPPQVEKITTPLSGAEGIAALRTGLIRVLKKQGTAMMPIRDLCLTGHRGKGRESEHTLADARSDLEGLFRGAVRTKSDDLGVVKLRQAALATVQLQRAIEDLLRHAEKATERNMALSPAGETWQLAPRDQATLGALHDMLQEGLEALVQCLETGQAPDIDAARSREIRLNAMESETRQELLSDADGAEEARSIALRLNSTDLVNAYESVGNHLYRLSEALAADVDQEV